MDLIRRIFYEAAAGNYALRTAYIPAKPNILADALSRYESARFCRLCPHAYGAPTLINIDLSELQYSVLTTFLPQISPLLMQYPLDLSDCTLQVGPAELTELSTSFGFFA